MTSFTLKILAMLLMLLDHIYTYLGRTSLDIPIWFGYLGKISAPIFFYLIIEGFYHTRSRKHYLQRLFGMAAFMVVIDIIFQIHNNIFLSLGFGVLMLCAIHAAPKYRENKLKYLGCLLGAILCGIIIAFFTEAGIYGLAMICIFYFLRNKKTLMALCYIAFSLIWLIPAMGPEFVNQAFLYDYQWMMVFAIIPIWFYNGQQGVATKWSKWLFYWFYPLHLIVVVTLLGILGPSPLTPTSPENARPNLSLLQEPVQTISASATFVSTDTFNLTLSQLDGSDKQVYLVNLYDAETKIEIADQIIQLKKGKTSATQKIKLSSTTTPLSSDGLYILTVYDVIHSEMVYEDYLSLE